MTRPAFWLALAPELVFALGAVVILLVGAIWRPRARFLGFMAVAVIAGGLATVVWQWVRIDRIYELGVMSTAPFLHFGDSLIFDHFSVMARFVLGGAALIAILLGWGFFKRVESRAPEALAMVMLSLAGFSIVASSNQLMLMYLGLEVGSIALYILAGFGRDRTESQEAGIKYFLLGAMASAVFVYGVALLFSATGKLTVLDIGQHLNSTLYLRPLVLLVGMGLVMIGLLFKISAVPFHSWSPDVYQGAPAGMVGYIGVAAKVGGLVALMRILFIGFEGLADEWIPILAAVSVLSMALGVLVGMVQEDVRRILAYSGIAHAGFVLTAFTAGVAGTPSIWFYLIVCGLQLLGAFGVVSVVSGVASSSSPLSAYRGLARTNPWMASVFSVFLLGMAGIPLTSGFFARFGVLRQAWDAGFEWLVIVGLIAAIPGVYLYLRVVAAMYLDEPDSDVAPSVGPGQRLVLVALAAVTIGVGFFPGFLLDLVGYALPL